MSESRRITDRFIIKDIEKDLLGRGGMGEVYRATDTQTGEIVAIKALDLQVVARDPDLLERFQREGEALRQLNHPNIVRMVTALEEDGRHYLVMEYVGGGSLENLLEQQGRLPAPRVIEIALEVADALSRAHHLGIIHRDLKPANVLLAEDGTPRLADFGIAHLTDIPRLTQTGVLVGTVDYVGPEICQGTPPDERSDIWAFGVLLFQMLTGSLPFEGKSLTARITAILTQPVPDLAQIAPEIPDALADLVYRMLEKDPRQRLPSVRLVGAELEAIQHGREPFILSMRHGSEPIVSPVSQRFAIPTPPSGSSTQAQVTHNLPVQPTLFIGRDAELCELARLLAEPGVRLVSILGVGGMGKTRLALEAGAAQLENYQHGVFFVPLAPLQSVESIVPTMAGNIGFSFYEGGEPRQQLLDYLRHKHMLLILDNFEHLLEGANLVIEITQTAPRVKVLITSRLRLNLQGEQLFHLSGMDFPDWETPEDALEYSAVKLFVQSARRVCPGFSLQADDLKYIARICRLVGGLPLGILLAAAWIECLAPAEIAAEIGRSLDFLETDWRDVPDRQRSLRVVFDHSWSLLTQREQDAFKGLSVFRGGFTREAAQQVTGATLRELMGLIDKSLLHRDLSGRYGIHELLRQHAEERLVGSGEANELYQRHAEYFLQLAERAEPELRGPMQETWLVFLRYDYDNLRTALAWSLKNEDVSIVLRLVGALADFWFYNGPISEGEKWFSQALTRAEGVPWPIRAKALTGGGMLAFARGYTERGEQWIRTALAIARQLEDKSLLASSLELLSMYATDNPQEYQEGIKFAEEALSIYRELDNKQALALVNNSLGELMRLMKEYERARMYYEECLDISRQIGNQTREGVALGNLAYCAQYRGDYQQAEKYALDALTLFNYLSLKHGSAWALSILAGPAAAQGNAIRAATLLGASEAAFEILSSAQQRADIDEIEGFVTMTRDQLTKQEFESAWAEGRRMTYEQAVALALGGFEAAV